MKKLIFTLALLAMASVAGANSFTAEGVVFDTTHDYNWRGDRYLINDGSFEAGCDVYWSCESDNGCSWITDLVPLGLWNYDGRMVAWLGGFSGGIATCWTYICQDIFIDGCTLLWWWMGYVNAEVMDVYVTVDEEVVFSHHMTFADHLQDYRQEMVFVYTHIGGSHTLCFYGSNEDNCAMNFGDNYFVDYVELGGLSATQDGSFSTVKAMY